MRQWYYWKRETMTLGDTKCCCVRLRPGDVRGLAGRGRQSLAAAPGILEMREGERRGGNRQEGLPAPVDPLHLLTNSKPSGAVLPACGADVLKPQQESPWLPPSDPWIPNEEASAR